MTFGAPARSSRGADAEQPTMRAVIQHRYGGPETLTVAEIARPVAREREVLIRVHAAGLNVADDIIMRGVPYFLRLLAGPRRPKHGIRGVDVAGTIAAVGSQVTDLRPGDDVFGGTTGAFAGGGFAEYASVPRDKVVAKPAGLTFAQAAAMPVAAVTALKALRDAARVRPGHRVLVNGASGGVGTFAVQVAKALGADVTGVCSTRNASLVRSLGRRCGHRLHPRRLHPPARPVRRRHRQRRQPPARGVPARGKPRRNPGTERQHARPLARRPRPDHQGPADRAVRAATHPHLPRDTEPARSARRHRAHRIRETHARDRPDIPAQ